MHNDNYLSDKIEKLKQEETKNNIIDLMNSVNVSNDLLNKSNKLISINTKDAKLISLQSILNNSIVKLEGLLYEYNHIEIDINNLNDLISRFNNVIDYVKRHITAIVVYIKKNKLYN